MLENGFHVRNMDFFGKEIKATIYLICTVLIDSKMGLVLLAEQKKSFYI